MRYDPEKLKKSIPIEDYYRATLGNPVSTDNSYFIYFCRFHSDKNTPNLKIKKKSGDYRCFVCGDKWQDIIDFHKKTNNLDFTMACKDLAGRYSIDCETSTNSQASKVVAEYDYRDISGKLVYQIQRRKPKKFTFCRPDGNGGWLYKNDDKDGVEIIPYNLPEAHRADIVYIPEGERKVDTLRAMGLVGTCNPFGAGKWKPEFSQYLSGKDVIILPDNDDVGHSHACDVAKTLLGTAKSIKIVKLPGLPPKGDIVDWVAKGHGKDELLQIVEQTDEWRPEEIEENQPEQEEKPQSLNQAQRLLEITSSLTLFHDQHKEGHVFLNNEVMPLRSKKIKQWLAHRFYQIEAKAPNSDSINQAIGVLEGQAIFESPEETLHNRIALVDNAFWYDLGNGKAVRITAYGWDILDAPILFRRYAHQQPQVMPIKGGDPWRVFESLNVAPEHQLLVLVFIISCFVPDIPHPIFHPHGAQGAGKTTACRTIKKICDPSEIEAIIAPRTSSELIQLLAHHHLCLFDNMSNLPPWMSDILAQACTGGGFSKRKLYTDDDDVIYKVKRCIGLNGINLLIYKPDLMDRSILLPLERIIPSKRMEESKLWEQFEKARPKILGGILDVLPKAIKVYPTVELITLSRMADFTRWGYAITEALGKDGNEFLDAYRSNINRQNEEIIQCNTLAQAVLTFMAERDSSWSGTIKEAWEKFRDISNADKKDNTFPKSNRTLRKHLERIKSNLIDYGITYKIGKREGKGNPITFQKGSDFGSFDTFDAEPLRDKGYSDEAKMKQTNFDASLSGQRKSLINMDVSKTDEANEANEANEAKKQACWKDSDPQNDDLMEIEI